VSIVETVEELLGEGKKKEVKTETVVLMPIRETDSHKPLMPIRETDTPITELTSKDVKKDILGDIPTGTNIAESADKKPSFVDKID